MSDIEIKVEFKRSKNLFHSGALKRHYVVLETIFKLRGK